MRETYQEALKKVLLDEGGYSNHPADKGGPTNWGITIADARMYWKPDATAADVRRMPVEVAYTIYRKQYADAIRYDELPAGVDYATLDFAINSGVSRAAKYLQRVLDVEPVDGKIGLVTLTAASEADSPDTIRQLYADRLKFLRGLHNYPTFKNGWERRCKEGLALALKLSRRYPQKPKIVPSSKPLPKDTVPLPPEIIKEESEGTGGKAIPEEVIVKPPAKSKTIWGGILGYLTGAAAMVSAVFEHLNNKYALAAFGAFTILGTVALWLIIQGRIDIGRVAQQLKDEE